MQYAHATSSMIAIAVMFVAPPAFAQEGNDSLRTSSEVTAGEVQQDNDIIVTAQRRAGRLQDVPASVSVVSAAAIEQQGITDFNDLSFKIPNVQVFQNSNLAGRTEVTIRGVPGRAGIFVDDVFVGDNSGINGLLVDIDRVEVLRGPQGTLYGRNSISGAINTITRKPGDELFVLAKARYGSFDSYYGAAALGGPITDGISAKVSGAYRKSDGFDRLRGGGRVNGNEDYAVQAQLRLRPTSALDILISGDYEKDDDRVGYTDAFADFTINDAPGAVFRNAARDGDPYDRIVPFRDAENRQRREVKGVSGRVELDLGGAQLTSITAYREIDYLYNRDGDGTEFSIITGTQPVDYHQFSQEVRLSSPSGGAFEWLVGGYYFKDKRSSSDSNFLGADYILPGGVVPELAPFAPALVPGGAAGVVTIGRLFASPILQSIIGITPPDPFLGTQTTQDSNRIESYAGFASVTVRPVEQIELTGGLRYTRERVKASYSRQATGLLTAFVPDVTTQFLDSGWDDNFSPTANVAYKPTRNLTFYATYSQGYRSGGFNTAPGEPVPPPNDAAQRSFRPEKVTNYEIGVKSSLIDDRLTANLSLFKMDYSDFQRSFYNIDPVAGVTINTFNAQASMKGLELQLVARPTRRLTVDASYGLQISKYDDYPNAPVSSYTQPGFPLFVDLTGAPLPFVPRHSVSAAAEYEQPIGGLTAIVGSDVQLRSDYNVADGVDRIRVVDSTVQLGAHIGIGDGERWRILGRVYNLTNEVFLTGLDYNSFVGTVYQTLSAPRTFAVEASLKF